MSFLSLDCKLLESRGWRSLAHLCVPRPSPDIWYVVGLQSGSRSTGSGSSGFRYLGLLFCSVAQSCLTFCDPMDFSTPGLPIHHQLSEFTQTHVHGVGDAIHPSYPLLSASSPTFSLSQHQGLFQWVSSSHQIAKVLEFQLQLQSFQWMFRTYFL